MSILRSFPKLLAGWCAWNLLAVMAASQSAAAADDYPAKPIRVIVSFAAGGPMDILARQIGEEFRVRSGQPLIIENRGGGNFIPAAQTCKAATPDGYTICFLTIAAVALNPILYPDLKYNPAADFIPITNVVSVTGLLTLHKSVPARSLTELADYSRTKPLSYAAFGISGPSQLQIEWVKKKAGVKMDPVPFPGGGPALLAFERNDVQVINANPTAQLVDKIKAGEATGIIVFAKERLSELPNVPTMEEAGIPSIKFDNWWGLFAPVGAPPSAISYLGKTIGSIVRDLAFAKKNVEAAGLEVIANTPEQFKDSLPFYRARAEELTKMAKD